MGREDRIGGADTCDLCHCKRDSDVSDSLIAPHIKLKEDKVSLLMSCFISRKQEPSLLQKNLTPDPGQQKESGAACAHISVGNSPLGWRD